MYEITMLIVCEQVVGINVKESGYVYEDMYLKKDIKGEILKVLKQKNISGKCVVSLLSTKNGSFYDSDEITVIVNEDITNVIFLDI